MSAAPLCLEICYPGAVDPVHRYDSLYYLQRLFGEGQLTPGELHLPPKAHRHRQSSTKGKDRGYGRIFAIDPKTGDVKKNVAYRRLQTFDARIPELRAHENDWDIFLGPQTWWRSGRLNGHRDPSWKFNTANLRWINGIPVDLDERYLNPHLRRIWKKDKAKFLELLHRKLGRLGIVNYLVVQTNGDYGLQIHVLVKPFQANQGEGPRNSTLTFKSVSAAMYKLLRFWGADKAAAKRPTQVFRWPGFGRPTKDHFRAELVMDVQEGPRASIYDLMQALHGQKLLVPSYKLMTRPARGGKVKRLYWCKNRPWTHLHELIDRGEIQGMAKGGRRHTAFKLAIALFAEAALHCPWQATEEAVLRRVRAWNARNIEPLPDYVVTREVANAAATTHRHIRKETWDEVCQQLGVRLRHPYLYTPKKEREIRKRDHMDEVEADLLQFLAKSGREWYGKQTDLCKAMQAVTEAEVALRSVQRAIAVLASRGAIQIESRRGRGGGTRLVLLTADMPQETPAVIDVPVSEVDAQFAEVMTEGFPVTVGEHNPPSNKEAAKADSVEPTRNDREVGGICPHVRVSACRGIQPGPVVASDMTAPAAPMGLLDLCRGLFGADLVVDVEGAVVKAKRPADPERLRKEMQRELAKSVVDVGGLVAFVREVTTRARMQRALDVASDLALAGVSEQHAGVLEQLQRKLVGAQRRFDQRREDDAWIKLEWAKVTGEDLRWLVERQVSRTGEREALVKLLTLAERRQLDGSEVHAEALREARRRLLVAVLPKQSVGGIRRRRLRERPTYEQRTLGI